MSNVCAVYYKNIRKSVPNTLKNRKLYLNYTKKMLNDYEKEHESFSYDDLVADLGEPGEVCDSKLLSMDADSLRKSMRIKKAILYAIVAVIVILAGFTIYALRDGIHQTVYIEHSGPFDPEDVG